MMRRGRDGRNRRIVVMGRVARLDHPAVHARGLVAAGYQVGYSAAGWFSARLCDRRGQSEILP
jgi:hypothetical protein